MSALDICEPEILRALQKENWQVVSKPHLIRTSERHIYADFSMQRIVKNQLEYIIVVEVKCFTNPKNDLQEFYTAIGQYHFYAAAFAVNNEDLPLYLALPYDAYERLILDNAMLNTLQLNKLKLIVVDIATERVVLWVH